MFVYKVLDTDDEKLYTRDELTELPYPTELIQYVVVECPFTGTLELMRS